jgi:hypothetical protein
MILNNGFIYKDINYDSYENGILKTRRIVSRIEIEYNELTMSSSTSAVTHINKMLLKRNKKYKILEQNINIIFCIRDHMLHLHTHARIK